MKVLNLHAGIWSDATVVFLEVLVLHSLNRSFSKVVINHVTARDTGKVARPK